MATVTPTVTFIGGDKAVVQVVWANMANGDTGAPFEWVDWADRCIHFSGTFGTGGTVKLRGSNTGTNYLDITDAQGNAISKTAEAIEQCVEVTRYTRPEVTAGDGTTSLTATLVARRAQPLRT